MTASSRCTPLVRIAPVGGEIYLLRQYPAKASRCDCAPASRNNPLGNEVALYSVLLLRLETLTRRPASDKATAKQHGLDDAENVVFATDAKSERAIALRTRRVAISMNADRDEDHGDVSMYMLLLLRERRRLHGNTGRMETSACKSSSQIL